MPTFQFLLHTTGIRHELDEADAPAIGFYAVRRTKAKDTDEASEAVLREFEADEKIATILQSGHDAGLEPMTEIDEIHRISWLESLVRWQHPGLIFYSEGEDADEEEEEP